MARETHLETARRASEAAGRGDIEGAKKILSDRYGPSADAGSSSSGRPGSGSGS